MSTVAVPIGCPCRLTRRASIGVTALALLGALCSLGAGAQRLDGVVYAEAEGIVLVGAMVRLLDEEFAAVDSSATDTLGRFSSLFPHLGSTGCRWRSQDTPRHYLRPLRLEERAAPAL